MAFSKEKAHERAEKFAAKGQHDKAAREYQSIVENDPKDIRAWLMLADCLVRCGDAPGAISRYLQVAGFYAQQKQHQKALAVYRQVLNLDPSRIDIHLKCADLNRAMRRVHDAVAGYEHVAQVQMQTGKIREALRTYEVICDTEPTAVPKRLRLAELYSREKLVDKAVDAFRIAADQLLEGGRTGDFVRVAERLLYHKNDDRPTIRKLARAYLTLGDPRRALMKLNGLLQADSHDHEGLELLAETFMALGKPDKAMSVVLELVRTLRESGPGGKEEAIRVIRRGLEWEPGNQELLERLRQLGGDVAAPAAFDGGESSEVEELDVDDAEVVELDEDDVLEEPSPRLVGEAETSRGRSMTDSVLSEVGQRQQPAPVRADGATDLDKILFEARVYVKYRLFEHALDHVQGVLDQDPRHVQAIALRARALTELGRADQAADTHVEVAKLVVDRDPELAREHVMAAIGLVPDHLGALALQADLGGGSQAAPAPIDDRVDAFDLLADDGDSGAIDLLADDEEDEADISIDVAEPEPEPEPTDRRRYPVENRFGLSDAGPLPSAEADEPRAEHTPAAGYVARPPEEATATPSADELDLSDLDDLSVGLDDGSGDDDLEEETTPISVPRPTRSAELEVELDDVEPSAHELDLAARAMAPEPDVSSEAIELEASAFARDDAPAVAARIGGLDRFEPELEAEFDELRGDDDDDALIDDAAPGDDLLVHEPAKADEAPAHAWPDISADLAEIRFFVDQGLDEDAEAALADLEQRHPGHPEIAKLAQELRGVVEAPVVDVSGAQPLVDLDDLTEDEEADAYLSAIFSDGAAPRKKEKRRAGAIAEVQDADPRTYFDLGTAYREMGLVDNAIEQFELAARDATWQSRALVMCGILRLHRGETDRAIADLRKALATARNEDERCQANYELGLLYAKIGDTNAAIESLQAVTAGFRDRDERLEALLG